MRAWLDLALEHHSARPAPSERERAATEIAVPLVPLVPKARAAGNFGTNGTNGTRTKVPPKRGAAPSYDDLAAQALEYADAAAYRRQLVRSWHAGLLSLSKGEAAGGGKDYVRVAVDFVLDGWAEQALVLGWTEQELLWADERAPWARIDRLGAAYLSDGIRAITAGTIAIARSPGSSLTLQRTRGDGRGCLPWEATTMNGDQCG